MTYRFLSVCFFLAVLALPRAAQAQTHDPGNTPLAIRGEVWIDIEPVYHDRFKSEVPLESFNTVRAEGRAIALRQAAEEAALYFSGMIYGWAFHYDIGERARGIAENFYVFEPLGEINREDPRFSVTDVEYRELQLKIWADYQLSDIQQKRMHTWRTGMIRNAQAVGYCPIRGISSASQWQDMRKAALKDAARFAVREMLRGSERNRPKEALGLISLASFPRFYIDSGRLAVSARFRVQINEIIPFAAY